MEISCIEPGPREEGKWPWGNFAKDNKNYELLLEQQLLHCGDASNVTWLNEVWTDKMNRPDAPPLKIVVEDGSHLLTIRSGSNVILDGIKFTMGSIGGLNINSQGFSFNPDYDPTKNVTVKNCVFDKIF